MTPDTAISPPIFDAAPREAAPRVAAVIREGCGVPPLTGGPLYPTFKRRLSDQAFYVAPALMWCALALRHGGPTVPTAANPAMEAGGLWGESKSQCLSLFGPLARKWLAPWIVVERRHGDAFDDARVAEVCAALAQAGVAFPLVTKPDRGYQGWGVKLAHSPADLAEYLAALPQGAGLMLQAYVAYQGEAGVFYVRRPGEARGRIASMALTYAPHVLGDGRRTLSALVGDDCVLRKSAEIFAARHGAEWDSVPEAGRIVPLTETRAARVGAVYRDAISLVTPALEERIDAIARDIEGFHFGRFDLRFDTLERFLEGEDLLILELNGAGAEMLHIWDGAKTLRQAYASLWRQYSYLFEIAAENIRNGVRPLGLRAMIRLQMRQERLRRCYPPTT
ncbi:MAG: ATP-grasp domain-containing protein [Salinarimonadaceae bacterium]|nr:MAG: ATP-grasp domain-containing protein [Salinarimonadaceae bacterium]